MFYVLIPSLSLRSHIYSIANILNYCSLVAIRAGHKVKIGVDHRPFCTRPKMIEMYPWHEVQAQAEQATRTENIEMTVSIQGHIAYILSQRITYT